MVRPALALLMGIALCAGCFTLPGPSAERDEILALETIEYQFEDQRVGGLRAGDPNAPRLILVHGSPGNAESWSDFLTSPLPGLDSVAIDRPGFGRSDVGPVVELERQAAALVPLLIERNGRWPILVGHSLGGPIVARLAADYPNRVSGLVIISGSLDPDLERLRWYNYIGKAISWLLPRPLRRSNQEMWSLEEELDLLSTRLGRIACPVTVVHGERDRLVPVENVAFLRRALTDAQTVRFVVLPNGDHFALWKEPYESLVRSLIGELGSRALGSD